MSRKPIAGPGEGRRDGNVNTNLMNVGGKLCAVVEGGSIPVELDYELASIRRTDFDGTLEAGFTGHPKFDPITGEHHALAYEPFQPVRYISVDGDGRATTKARIDLPHIPLIHDMAFTQSFIIVPDFPVTFQPQLSHTDFPWLWDERRASRIGLLPRNGDVSGIQWFETPRCFGEWIYFASNRTGEDRIWKIPASGGDAIRVTDNVGYMPLESPDGTYLYYVQSAFTPGPLWRVPTSGGVPDKVLEGVVLGNFVVLERGIYYIDRPSGEGGIYWIDRPSGETRLQYFDFSSRRSKTVASNLGDVDTPLTDSADGRTVLYARWDSSVDDLMLVENFR